MRIAQFLTDFADQAVVLPLALAIAAGLLVGGWRRGALVWLVSIVGVLGTMLVLKLLFMACGARLPFPGVHSPSGHTASAEAVYGGVAALFLRRCGASTAVAIAAAVLFAVVAGVTRLVLAVHSLPEVVVGTALGLVGIVALIGLAGPPPATLRWGRLAAAGLVLVVLLHGRRLGAEPVIDALALRYYWPLSVCAPL